MDNFVDLHLHSTFSNLDGFGSPEQVVSRAKAIGRKSIALTDHGSVSGLVQLKKACEKNDIKPIYGCEFYMVEDLDAMYANHQRGKNHITVLASNIEGYRNLLGLASDSYSKGFYFKPTIDKNLLFNRNEGLIVLSGCWSGMMQTMLKNGNKIDAMKLADEFKEVFTDNRYFLELQHYLLFQETTDDLRYISDTLKLPMVLTCDPHYLTPEQAPIQEVIHAIRDRRQYDTGQSIFGAHQWPVDDLYNIMKERFPKLNVDELFENVCQIGERCNNVEMPVGQPPRYIKDSNDKRSVDRILLDLCRDGIKKRGLEKAGEIYRERLRREFDLIVKKDFIDYFLIVCDMVMWAKNNGIVVGPARGSSAGSLICYLLGITEVNPFDYDLVFERFIDENRDDLPDIDIDFDKERRNEVKKYMIDRYGEDKVCNIATFARFKGKNTLEDVGKTFSIPKSYIEEIKKLIPIKLDSDTYYDTIQDAMEAVQRSIDNSGGYGNDGFIKQVDLNLEWAALLEGQLRHMGKHAAGIIVGSRPLDEVIALYKNKDEDDEYQSLSSIEMKDASYLGLLKIDVLGINTLTQLKCTCDLIGMSMDDLYKIPMNDQKTLDGFRSHDVGSVFQFDGGATKGVLKQLPNPNFEELTACTALSRPGPNNADSTKHYIEIANGNPPAQNCFVTHPKLKEITGKTHYQIVYQEQALSIVREVGQMSWADANKVRVAISKKLGESELESYFGVFEEGTIKSGLTKEDARMIWENIKTMGQYAFNKSHAVSYTIISFWSMYLKQHYPLEFYAGMLIKEKDKDKIKSIIKEVNYRGIPIYPPVLGKSEDLWSIDGNGLRAGLSYIEGIGDKTAKVLVDQEYKTREDFTIKKNRSVTKKTIQSLENCKGFDGGDFDVFGLSNFKLIDKVTKNRIPIGSMPPDDQLDNFYMNIAGNITNIKVKDKIKEDLAKGKSVDGMKNKDVTKYAIVTLEDETTDSMLIFVDRYKYKDLEYVLTNAMNKQQLVYLRGEKIKNMGLMRMVKCRIFDNNGFQLFESAYGGDNKYG